MLQYGKFCIYALLLLSRLVKKEQGSLFFSVLKVGMYMMCAALSMYVYRSHVLMIELYHKSTGFRLNFCLSQICGVYVLLLV